VRLGVHVSIEGGLCRALERAKGLGCQAMQIFSRSPRNWKGLRLDTADIEKFKRERARLKIFPLIVHIPYLINLSSPEEGLYKKSIKNFIDDVTTADRIGAEYFVTHLGSHKGKGEAFGIKRFSTALNIILKKINLRLMILLETTAGSGDWLGYKFEHIRDIVKGIKKKENIGICLDTAHVYAAGYDMATERGLSQTLRDFDRLIGLGRLKVVHLNDSKGRFGSRVDRHEHIGKGCIGKTGMRLILTHPALKRLTFILETPKETIYSDRKNLALARRLAG
jgi:deoxyribonuclease IV